jgi:hypothetical protein
MAIFQVEISGFEGCQEEVCLHFFFLKDSVSNFSSLALLSVRKKSFLHRSYSIIIHTTCFTSQSISYFFHMRIKALTKFINGK